MATARVHLATSQPIITTPNRLISTIIHIHLQLRAALIPFRHKHPQPAQPQDNSNNMNCGTALATILSYRHGRVVLGGLEIAENGGHFAGTEASTFVFEEVVVVEEEEERVTLRDSRSSTY